MIASKSVAQCDTNKVCTSKSVLKYLYIQNEKANYLAKDTFNLGQILSKQNQQLILKDSLISNRNEALNICENITKLRELELSSNEKQIKNLNKKVAIFKITTILASITTILALFR